MILLHEQTDKK